MYLKFIHSTVIFILLLLFSVESIAGIVIGGTRVIFTGNNKQTSISVQNPDNKPYLVQSWLDHYTLNPLITKTIPFIITPPLSRLDSKSSNSLRITKIGELPEDRESVYWLNIKSIPTSDPNAMNQLTLSVNTRIKLFYRPALLNNSDAAKAYTKIIFTRVKNMLCAKNPTPYYLSFSELSVNKVNISDTIMIEPMKDNQCWTIPSKALSNSIKLKWITIGDYGEGSKPMEQIL